MSIAQSLLAEFDAEMEKTRVMLERLPEDKLDYKPDPKSMSMGRLAGHVAEMPSWGAVTLQTESLDLNGTGYQVLTATSRAHVLAAFDRNIADSRAALAAASDESFVQPWSLLMGGKALFTMPRIAVIRSMVMNHTIHHRGQLTVYYRVNGVPIPALYGPSADEGMS